MSSVGDIIESIVKYGTTGQLSKYLNSCEETKVFSIDNEVTSGVIALTNRLLNESCSRRDGLLVLKCLLAQLPSELLQANILSWMQHAVKGLSQKESYSTVVVAADVTCVLLRLSTKFPECRKEVSLNVVSKIHEVLYDLKNSEELLKIVLSTLSTLLQYFSKSGVSWKDKFEKFLVTLVENDEETVFLASRCYLGLAASGQPGTEYTYYKENWIGQFESVSVALHSILDKLFDNVNEIEQLYRGRVKWKLKFQIPQVNEKVPYLKMSRLAQQFSSFCQFLEVMLFGQFPVSKRVTPEVLLSVVCRGLAVTPQTLHAHETSDTPSLLAVLPELHSSCLGILTALIKSCQTNLIKYGPMICKLVSQVLKSTELKKGTYGQNKPYRSVRISAYECLTSWLSVASCSSNIEKHHEMVDFLISDIQFKKPTVTLNLSSKMLKGKLGKKQRQALVNQTVNHKDDYVADREANKDVCCAALAVVPALLESASSLLSPQIHKDLQTAITSELLMTQLNSGDHVPLPYSDRSCRLGLYKSFMAICLNYHPSFPPPLSFASRLISSGLQDPCQEVVQFCVLSLAALEKMLRPIGPTLSVPIELPEAFSTLKKVVPLLNGNKEKRRLLAKDQPSDSGPSHPDGSPDQPEINPLLVDAEMSEFDFLYSVQDEAFGDGRKGAEVADDSPEISVASEIRMGTEAPDESPVEISNAGNDRLTYEESKASPATIIEHSNGEINPCGPDISSDGTGIIDQNDCMYQPDVSAKRKPLPELTESPAPKKTRSVVTDITSPELSEKISVEVAIDPVSEIPSDSSVAQTVVPKTVDISAPENDLEEEMLRSFVDVVD